MGQHLKSCGIRIETVLDADPRSGWLPLGFVRRSVQLQGRAAPFPSDRESTSPILRRFQRKPVG
jgi:hypothetical protein